MTNEFTREARYAVLKSADVMQCLTVSELIELRRIQAKVEEHRAEIGRPPLDCVVVESDWPEYEPTWRAIEASVTGAQAQPAQTVVAYLDLGVGGYMDIGTDLTDEALAALPKGRHMLGIVGTYGVEGYIQAQPAPIIPEGWKLVPIEPTPGMIDAAEYVDWGDADVRGSCINAWDRMLAAAPEAKP